jgi:hypothetical protein
MRNNFLSKGFTSTFKVNFSDELINLQNLIYKTTKNYLVDHDPNISLEQKINLNFKNIPNDKFFSNLMHQINNSDELHKLLSSAGIKESFKLIFDNPEPFEISTFRARIPNQERTIYKWHQDEGTWHLSQNQNHINKFPATLWLSINGADKNDSIQLVKFSHKGKLYNHSFVKGQGYFNINSKNKIDENLITNIEVKSSEAVIFHPLTLHRSVPSLKINFRPRYTIDIRYFDKEFKPNFNVEFLFKIKKTIKSLFNL